jgi:hypothetical protein
MSDLELVDTRELIDELQRRHSSMIFAGKPLAEDGVIVTRTSGSDTMCIGMCYGLLDDLLMLRRSNKQDPEG